MGGFTDGNNAMNIHVRQACHPEAVRSFNTGELRGHFLVERIFEQDEIALTYSHVDRLVIGGAMPIRDELRLGSSKEIGSPNFLDRRELGICQCRRAGARVGR